MLDELACTWFPDLRRVEAGSDRHALWTAAYGPILRSPTYLVIALVSQLAGQILVVVPVMRLARAHGYYRPFLQWLLPAVVAAAACLAVIWLVRKRITRSLRRQLTERGMPTCITCGYDLTGNTSGVCPECGCACTLNAPIAAEVKYGSRGNA